MKTERDSFDCTPKQYHAALDKLWDVLGVEGVQDSDVFELVVDEIRRLRAELQDNEDWHNHIMAEDCLGSEVHCTCVPTLRKEIQNLTRKGSQ